MKKLSFYLVGPIQYVKDYMTWRQEMADFLEELGHSADFPWGEVYHSTWLKGEFKQWLKEMNTFDWLKRVRKYMRTQVIRYDLNILLKADGLIFYIPKATKTVGSFGELTLAYYIKKLTTERRYKGKRIFVIVEDEVENLSYWMIGCSDRVFFSMEAFKSYFKKNFNRRKRRKRVKE